MKSFNIGTQFSRIPMGRFYKDNKASCGERFREEFLLKLLRELKEDEKLKIILDDGVNGYGSSFLSEGFAGVVKYGYMKSDDLLSKIEFVYSDPDFEFFKNRAIEYIKQSKFNSVKYKSTNE